MRTTISSSTLRDEGKAVAGECRPTVRPNAAARGKDTDPATVGTETFDRDALHGMAGLSGLLAEGHADVEAGRTRLACGALADLRARLAS